MVQQVYVDLAVAYEIEKQVIHGEKTKWHSVWMQTMTKTEESENKTPKMYCKNPGSNCSWIQLDLFSCQWGMFGQMGPLETNQP